jgi:nucleoside-diphosphate-sugar epimerase
LTGATGFIGAHVTRALLADTCEVHALVLPGEDTWRIAELLPQLHVVEGDLTDVDALAPRLEEIRPDTCIHLAWYAAHGKYWTALENLDVLAGSLQLVRQLAALGCERFVGVGTCVEYDTGQGYFSEESLLRPTTLYAASKLSLYYLLEQVGELTGMKTAWLRFFYLYGPMEDSRRLVPYAIRSLLNDEPVKTTTGEQVRDYLHVEDVAAAVWAVTQSELSGAVNIGSGKPVTVADLVTKVGRIMEREDLIHLGAIPMRPGDPPFLCANNEKLRSTGWVPRYDLDAGLRDTIAWWEESDEAK